MGSFFEQKIAKIAKGEIDFSLLEVDVGGSIVFVGAWKDEAMDAVDQAEGVEVDDEAQRGVEELHVAEKLGFVDREDFSDCFQFEDEAVVDDYVECELFLEDESFIFDCNVFLVVGWNLSQLEFSHETFFIDGLEEAGAFQAVDFDGGADDFAAESVGSLEVWVHCFERGTFNAR
jgi:hypothetical protein